MGKKIRRLMIFAGVLDTTPSCANPYGKLVTLAKHDVNENWLLVT